jgi:hypothetical protein
VTRTWSSASSRCAALADLKPVPPAILPGAWWICVHSYLHGHGAAGGMGSEQASLPVRPRASSATAQAGVFGILCRSTTRLDAIACACYEVFYTTCHMLAPPARRTPAALKPVREGCWDSVGGSEMGFCTASCFRRCFSVLAQRQAAGSASACGRMC